MDSSMSNLVSFIPSFILNGKAASFDVSLLKFLPVIGKRISDDNLTFLQHLINAAKASNPEITVKEILDDDGVKNSLKTFVENSAKTFVQDMQVKAEVEKQVSIEMHNVLGLCPNCGTTHTLANFANSYSRSNNAE